jgi:hypothetical protein
MMKENTYKQINKSLATATAGLSELVQTRQIEFVNNNLHCLTKKVLEWRVVG